MPDVQVDWVRLKTFAGSQDAAFEELCNQLFGAECRAEGGRWVPTGRIDAGVEGYGIMPGGSEWGIQAKWFLTSPGPQQWAQVGESVTTALDRHPRLTRYVVCMPIDLSDARTPRTESARQRWEKLRVEYESRAAKRGMTVSFEFRGSHELASRLITPENRGRRSYWFGGPEFSSETIRRRIEDKLSAVGPRYSKELNVDVPLSSYVDAMTLSPRFVERVFAHYRAITKRMSSLNSDVVRDNWGSEANSLAQACSRICEHIRPLAEDPSTPVAWKEVARLALDASAACGSLSQSIRIECEASGSSVETSTNNKRNAHEHQVYNLWKLASALARLNEYAEGSEACLSRVPFLLLVGEAGSGKTHFLCDVAVRTVEAGNIAILALGSSDFDSGGLWCEVARRDGTPINHEELLGALQAAAETTQTRALVLVDAINEGPSATYWNRELSVIINQVKRYPRVGLIVSVRDTFLNACVRDDAKAQLHEIVHEGFAYDVIEAQRAFFRNFGIREPAVPLLLPEFANPLFLTLFCKGIVAAGLSEVPRGLSGLTAIFRFFVDAQNRKISSDLDVDPNDRLVQRALDALAAALTPERPNTLGRAEAKAIVDGVHTAPQFSRSLFAALEREGLISSMSFGDASYSRFTYERMADHTRACQLLQKIRDEDAKDTHRLSTLLAEALATTNDRFPSDGLFEALSLQVPERYGRELLALLPTPHYVWQVEAVLRVLPWRRPDSVGGGAASLVFRLLETEANLREHAVECLLSCALIPGHPLNANRLHAYLRGLDMPRRDAIWTVTVSRRQYGGSAAMRMTTWARQGAFGLRGDQLEGAQAAATALLWLCTSTNRRVRDEATKGVVAILDTVPSIATALYKRFCDCNDPYVVQRLYAAIAGHAMRTVRPTSNLTHLAEAVLRRARDPGMPVDIVARDYARTVVERALYLHAIDTNVDITAVRPPYASAPPDPGADDDALFERYSFAQRSESPDLDRPRGLLLVHSSLGPHGDFARYTVGTNSRGDWLPTPLSEDAPVRGKERREAFSASLSPRQNRLYKKLLAAQRAEPNRTLTMLLRTLDGNLPVDGAEQTDDNCDEAVVRRRLVASLDTSQVQAFEALDGAGNDFERYDLTRATRWMFRRVLEMGYGGSEAYAFDECAARDSWERGEGRQPATIERIGKKYQWIAYYEFMARMADNYYLVDWHTDNRAERYDAPPQVITRDIDPSLLVVDTRRPSFEPHPQAWWSGPEYADWQEHVDVSGWMRSARSLPDPVMALATTDPAGVQWICLNVHLSWREREVLLEDLYDVPRRELWYLIFGYLVPKSEGRRAYRWLRRQNFSGRWLRPEAEDRHRLLWGELFWAPSFALDPGGLGVPPDALIDVARKSTTNLLIPATGAYVHERVNDNSVFDTIRIEFPIADLIRGVGGVGSDPEQGAWLDASGETVCIDPSVSQPGPGAVLIRRDRLEAFLRKSPFALIWTLLSEKQIVGGGAFGRDHGRLVTSGAYWFREAADGAFSLEGGKTSRFED